MLVRHVEVQTCLVMQGVTPLHLAAASGNLEVAKVLWDIHVSPATFVGVRSLTPYDVQLGNHLL